jgi:hypothetical protein
LRKEHRYLLDQRQAGMDRYEVHGKYE